jgi:hypothetical protein
MKMGVGMVVKGFKVVVESGVGLGRNDTETASLFAYLYELIFVIKKYSVLVSMRDGVALVDLYLQF